MQRIFFCVLRIDLIVSIFFDALYFLVISVVLSLHLLQNSGLVVVESFFVFGEEDNERFFDILGKSNFKKWSLLKAGQSQMEF